MTTEQDLAQRLLLGRRIGAARKERGLSQQALADRLGVERGTISEWERGKNRPSGITWAKLERELGAARLTLDPPPAPEPGSVAAVHDSGARFLREWLWEYSLSVMDAIRAEVVERGPHADVAITTQFLAKHVPTEGPYIESSRPETDAADRRTSAPLANSGSGAGSARPRRRPSG